MVRPIKPAKTAKSAKRATSPASIDAKPITVKVIPLDELRIAALAHWQDTQWAKGNYEADGFDADEATEARWMVNYIRHDLCDYDRALDAVAQKGGDREDKSEIRRKVFDAIADAYPYLREECERQAWYRDSAL